MSAIKDINLAKSGWDKINWVKSYMPILNSINKRFSEEKPFAGKKISMSIHLEAKTAYLALTLAAGGAEVYVTGCNPLSTQDDVAAALVDAGFEVNAWRGVTDEEYEEHLKKTLSLCPDVMIDDGGDLTHLLHGECREYGKNLIGGAEETTTGIHRLLSREKAGKLDYTMVDVNDADCKHLFDNRYGTGQSTLDGIMNATNLFLQARPLLSAAMAGAVRVWQCAQRVWVLSLSSPKLIPSRQSRLSWTALLSCRWTKPQRSAICLLR